MKTKTCNTYVSGHLIKLPNQMMSVLEPEQSTSYKIVKYNQLHTEMSNYCQELHVNRRDYKVLEIY